MTTLVRAVVVAVLLTGCAVRPVVMEPIAEVMAPSLPQECPLFVLTAYAQARKRIDIERYPWWGPRVPCEHPLWWQRVRDWSAAPPEPPDPPSPGYQFPSEILVIPRLLWPWSEPLELSPPPPDAPPP